MGARSGTGAAERSLSHLLGTFALVLAAGEGASGRAAVSAGAVATRAAAQETDIAARVRQTAGRIRATLARLETAEDPALRRVCEQVEAIIRRNDYSVVVPRDTTGLERVIAQERDGVIVVNRDAFSALSDAEAEALIFHELTHMLPAQKRRLSVAKNIDRGLPASPEGKRAAMLAPTEEGRRLRLGYKQLLALAARDEIESYTWQLAYMTHQARERGHASLQVYLQELASATRLPTQALSYGQWLAAMEQGRLEERLVIGNVLHVAGPEEWPLLRALAADEGVDVTSQDAIEAWLVSWAMAPEFNGELPESSPGRLDWKVWVGAGLAGLLGLAVLRRWARRQREARQCA